MVNAVVIERFQRVLGLSKRTFDRSSYLKVYLLGGSLLLIGLLIAASRGLGRGERHVRAGKWLQGGVPLQTRVSGKRLGIVGMGRIGRVIAKRASGFEMKIAYHSRRKVAAVPFAYYDRLVDLAKNSDFLVAIIPGGKDTFHIERPKPSATSR